jgi:hypothetical protein
MLFLHFVQGFSANNVGGDREKTSALLKVSYALSEEEDKRTAAVLERTQSCLGKVPSRGAAFTTGLTRVLIPRDDSWVTWKNESCSELKPPYLGESGRQPTKRQLVQVFVHVFSIPSPRSSIAFEN